MSNIAEARFSAFAALSPAISHALIGVIVGEFIGAEGGIGRLIMESEARGEARDLTAQCA